MPPKETDLATRVSVILPANLVLLLIGMADLVTTLVWLASGVAIEVNPVMSSVLTLGMPAFIGVKLGTLAVYVAVMEWYRRRRSARFAELVGLITVSAYLIVYSVSLAVVNL